MDLFQVVSFLPDNPRRCKLAEHARTIVELRKLNASFGMIADHLHSQAGLRVTRQTVAQYYHRIEARLQRATALPEQSGASAASHHAAHAQVDHDVHPGMPPAHVQVVADLRQQGASFGQISEHLKDHAGISVTPECLARQLSRAEPTALDAKDDGLARGANTSPQVQSQAAVQAGPGDEVESTSERTTRSFGAGQSATQNPNRESEPGIANARVAPSASAGVVPNPASTHGAPQPSSRTSVTPASVDIQTQDTPVQLFNLQSAQHRAALDEWRAKKKK